MMPCPKCQGSGLVARENAEADADIHPILSKHQTVCDACGGGGTLTAKQAHRLNQEAASAAAG